MKKSIASIPPLGRVITGFIATLCLPVFLVPASATGAETAAQLEPLPLVLPAPSDKGTPVDLPSGPHIEPLSKEKRPPFLAPKGSRNVAAGKAVTSSVKPFIGELQQITDGKKEALDEHAVEMKRGLQYVQVDLGQEHEIAAIVMWHDHRYFQVMHDAVVQVSNDPEFQTGVITLFNNDLDNSAGLGVGTDREYFETYEGKLVDGKGTKARHVRCYTQGSSDSALNSWAEIEVYAPPAK